MNSHVRSGFELLEGPIVALARCVGSVTYAFTTCCSLNVDRRTGIVSRRILMATMLALKLERCKTVEATCVLSMASRGDSLHMHLD